MLKTIDSGNVQGNDYRQDDIVHLTTTVEAIVAAGSQPLPFQRKKKTEPASTLSAERLI